MRDARALSNPANKDQHQLLAALAQNDSWVERPEDWPGTSVYSSHDISLHGTPSF
jgi:hypothetical protein